MPRLQNKQFVTRPILNLLNESRELTERIINILSVHTALLKRFRTYRQKARKQYLELTQKVGVIPVLTNRGNLSHCITMYKKRVQITGGLCQHLIIVHFDH